jgi:hypothetical protein
MIFEIPNDSLIIIGIVMLIFLPQIHLLFILIIFGISENISRFIEQFIIS